jgi:hypothetical protein
MNPTAVLQPDDISFTRQRLEHTVVCVDAGDLTDGVGYFFGTSDGYVMREDVGTSLDGEPIPASMRLHYNHFKSPSVKKRFRKLVLELDSRQPITIKFRQQFDYDDGMYKAGDIYSADLIGSGGSWDVDSWDAFRWSLPAISQLDAHIDGVGRNMGLLFFSESSTDEPYTIQGLLTHYSPIGIAR